MERVRTSISYPDEIKEKLTKLAKKEGRTLSNYITMIVRDYAKSLMSPVKKKGAK